jgi:hypothetical protein
MEEWKRPHVWTVPSTGSEDSSEDKQWRYNFLCRSEQFLLKMEPLVLKKEADVHATNCDDFISTINNDNADVVSVLPDNMIAVHQRREVVSVVQEQSTYGCKLLMS